MAEGMQYESRMSALDSIFWAIERDPELRTTITGVFVLDRSPDPERFAEAMERAIRAIPRLRQRVVEDAGPLAPPRWEVDPDFTPSFHVMWIKAPGDGSLRALLDLAAPVAMQSFDKDRPLWRFFVVEELEGGRAALVLKLHHALTDGVGFVRMLAHLMDADREGSEREPPPELDAGEAMSVLEGLRDALLHASRQRTRGAWRLAGGLATTGLDLLRHPLERGQQLLGSGASLARALWPVSEPASPIMRGRSRRMRFDVLEVPLAALLAARRKAEGTLNDAFVAAVAGGLGRYHDRHGRPVAELRMTMPINVRSEDTAGQAGNRLVTARFSVPVDVADPVERMRRIGERAARERAEPAVRLMDDVYALLAQLPRPVTTALFGTMLKSIDFVTSNVPGPTRPMYVAGAEVQRVIPLGPLGGAAANITLFSYAGTCHLGIHSDPAAVPDPEVFVACLREGIDEVAQCG